MSLSDILSSIEGLPHVRILTQTSVAYPAVSALHLFGIALVFGSIVPVDLRLLRLFGAQFDPVLPTLVRTALIGFAIAVGSGVLLASIRILDYAQNPAFLMKMVILLLAGANALFLRIRSGSRHVETPSAGLLVLPRPRFRWDSGCLPYWPGDGSLLCKAT